MGNRLQETGQRLGRRLVRTLDHVRIPMGRRLGVGTLGREVLREMGHDHLAAFAGNLTYNALLAIFPFLLFILLTLRIFHQSSLVNSLVTVAQHYLPGAAADVFRNSVLGIARAQANGALAIGAVFLALGSLWAASAGIRAIMEATNVMYEVPETRSLPRQLVLSVELALSAEVLWICALAVIVAGRRIGADFAGAVGLGGTFAWGWTIVQWIILVGAVLLAFGLTYRFTPNTREEFGTFSPGAWAATAAWVIFSLVFAFIINNFIHFLVTPLYGWFAGIIVLIFYMYYASFILLLGAEINQVLQRPPESRADKQTGSAFHRA